MLDVKWIGFTLIAFASFVPAEASLPEYSRDRVIQTGTSLRQLLEADSPLLLRCARENAGTRLFSSFCREFVEQLQRKINLMVVETDVQIQAGRLADAADQEKKGKPRLDLLIRLNTSAVQAEESIRALKAGISERNFKDHLSEILPDSKKVRDIFDAYARLSSDERS
ncbi:hypothetical protein EB061_05255 [bacterium]|nr:hypothetical protein [bacterium]